MIAIRRMRVGEGAALRDIRLRAIRDTPEAFAVSLDETLAETEEGWKAWARLNAAGETHVMYVAEAGEQWAGMAGGMFDASRHDGVVEVISMWVDPAYRRQGIGRRLVDGVAAWARDRGVRRLELWVTETNASAIQLYRGCGFEKTGESQPLPSNMALAELRMAREL